MSTHTLTIDFEFEAETLAGAYAQVADLLSKVMDPLTIKNVQLDGVKPPRPGHVPGCRGTVRGGAGCGCDSIRR